MLLPGGVGSYRAVAVVKKSNPGVSLRNLAGKKTCHTGVNRTAGWIIPVGRLVSSGDIGGCDVVGGTCPAVIWMDL